MKSIALLALLATSGCSFLTARATNNPRESCSRTVGRIDTALALLGVVGFAAFAVNTQINSPHDHNNWRAINRVGFGVTIGVSFLEGIQAVYGLGVADRCEADRAKLLQGATR